MCETIRNGKDAWNEEKRRDRNGWWVGEGAVGDGKGGGRLLLRGWRDGAFKVGRAGGTGAKNIAAAGAGKWGLTCGVQSPGAVGWGRRMCEG
jgi:hypothetical protein